MTVEVQALFNTTFMLIMIENKKGSIFKSRAFSDRLVSQGRISSQDFHTTLPRTGAFRTQIWFLCYCVGEMKWLRKQYLVWVQFPTGLKRNVGHKDFTIDLISVQVCFITYYTGQACNNNQISSQQAFWFILFLFIPAKRNSGICNIWGMHPSY